jgi:hypothetical protein
VVTPASTESQRPDSGDGEILVQAASSKWYSGGNPSGYAAISRHWSLAIEASMISSLERLCPCRS